MKKLTALIVTLALITGCAEGGSEIAPAQIAEVAEVEVSIPAKTTEATTTEAVTKAEKTQAPTETKPEETEPPIDLDPAPNRFLSIRSADYPLSLKSKPIYEVDDFLDDVIDHPTITYEEWLDIRRSTKSEADFVKYEIIGIYTPEEAMKITKGEVGDGISTLYRARIIYDYLNQEKLDIEINLAKVGLPTTQWRGNPQYSIGDVYISKVRISETLNENSNWCIATITFAVHKVNGVEFAYHIPFSHYMENCGMKFADRNGRNIDIGVLSSERTFVTTTKNNPVRYINNYSNN